MEIKKFKESAKAVNSYLASQGIQASHSVMLDALSKGFGQRTWSALRARLDDAQAPAALAAQYFDEVLEATETFSDVIEAYGERTLFDVYYLNMAILKETFIDAFPSGQSRIVEFLDLLPSAEQWKKYVKMSEEIRSDVVSALVEDVASKLRRHGGAVGSWANARDLASQSAELLNEEPTPKELDEAANQLTHKN